MSELYHHGVKGMKWGVRRYQNKDGTLTPRGKQRVQEIYEKHRENLEKSRRYTLQQVKENKAAVGITEYSDHDVIRKGSVLNRMTVSGKEDLKKSLYVSATDEDRYSYEMSAKEGLLPQKVSSSGAWYRMELEAVSDLKVARGKEIVDYLLSTRDIDSKAKDFMTNPDRNMAITDALDNETVSIYQPNKKQRDIAKVLYDSYDPGYKEAKKVIRKAFEEDKDYRDKMYDHFKKKGYDAVEDINDSFYLSPNGSESPMILLDPSTSVKLKRVYEV